MSVYCVAMFTEVSMQALAHPVSQYPVYPLYASSSNTPPLLKCDCQCWITQYWQLLLHILVKRRKGKNLQL